MNICIFMAESLHCSPETITTLLIACTPILNVFGVKKIKSKKEGNPVISITWKDLEGIMLSEINYDIFHMCNLKMQTQDFPGGPVIKIPNSGLLPGQRAMIPHAACHGQINKSTKLSLSLFFFFFTE